MNMSVASIIRLYRDEGRSYDEIGEAAGVCGETIRRILRRNAVPPRRAPRPEIKRPVRPPLPPLPSPAPRSRLRPEAERNTVRPRLSAGMVWCSQCDDKVPEVRAKTCSSPFCKAEVAR